MSKKQETLNEVISRNTTLEDKRHLAYRINKGDDVNADNVNSAFVKLQKLQYAEEETLTAMENQQDQIEQAFSHVLVYLNKKISQYGNSENQEKQTLLDELKLINDIKMKCYRNASDKNITQKLDELTHNPIINQNNSFRLWKPRTQRLIEQAKKRIPEQQPIEERKSNSFELQSTSISRNLSGEFEAAETITQTGDLQKLQQTAENCVDLRNKQQQLAERMQLTDELFADVEQYLLGKIDSWFSFAKDREILHEKLSLVKELKFDLLKCDANISKNDMNSKDQQTDAQAMTRELSANYKITQQRGLFSTDVSQTSTLLRNVANQLNDAQNRMSTLR